MPIRQMKTYTGRKSNVQVGPTYKELANTLLHRSGAKGQAGENQESEQTK